MRLVFMLLISALTLSCGLEQVGEAVRTNEEGVWASPSFSGDFSDKCCAVAFEYPEGYDWHADQEKGSVRCFMVLFVDGSPVLRIPVSDEDKVSSDIGRHRLVGGHLYTDFTDGENTFLKKDGRLLYTVPGAEEVVSILINKGSLHVLSCIGEGFRYRVDGELVLERSSGLLYPYCGISEGEVCFFFSQQAMTVQGSEQRYYEVTEGKVSRLDIDEGYEKVWDIRDHEGKTCVMAESDNKPGLWLISDGKPELVNVLRHGTILSCSFVDSDQMSIYVRFITFTDVLFSQIFWIKEAKRFAYSTGHTVSSVLVDDEGCALVVNPAQSVSGHVISDGATLLLPDGFALCTQDCICRKDSTLCLGLSSTDDGFPIIWKEGVTDTLKINGYISVLQ